MSDTSSSTGPARFAEHNLVATYASPEQARSALQMLERKGVEAGDIELFGPGMRNADLPQTNQEQQAADVAMTTDVGKRLTVGIFGGAIIGAVIGAIIGLVIDGGGRGLVVGAIGGAVVGVALGFFYSGYSGLPVNEQFAETFQSDGGETSLSVRSEDPAHIDKALEALRGSDAKRLALCGPDGQLHDA